MNFYRQNEDTYHYDDKEQNNSDPTCSEKFIGVATLLYKK